MQVWRFGDIMHWYRVSQMNSLRIEDEESGPVRRVLLRDGYIQVGKLVINTSNKEYYIISAFQIAPQYQCLGWGSKMMQRVLDDVGYQDRPIIVTPAPYGNDIGTPRYMEELMGLQSMYEKFGFKHSGGVMIREVQESNELV